MGVHWDVQVTGSLQTDHIVSQAFCSALPVRYTQIPSARWASFASLVLEGADEATIWAAVLNAHRSGSNTVFLTWLGGGAFGNQESWIHDAIRRALRIVLAWDLDVRLVSHRTPSRAITDLVGEFD